MTENNPSLGQIVRRHFNLNFVPSGDADEVFPHFPADVSENFVAVFKLYPVHGRGENLVDDTVDLNEILIFLSWHTKME